MWEMEEKKQNCATNARNWWKLYFLPQFLALHLALPHGLCHAFLSSTVTYKTDIMLPIQLVSTINCSQQSLNTFLPDYLKEIKTFNDFFCFVQFPFHIVIIKRQPLHLNILKPPFQNYFIENIASLGKNLVTSIDSQSLQYSLLLL